MNLKVAITIIVARVIKKVVILIKKMYFMFQLTKSIVSSKVKVLMMKIDKSKIINQLINQYN